MRNKDRLYDLADAAILSVFRRGRYYRELGNQYKGYVQERLPEIFGSIDNQSSSHLQRGLDEYRNWAYLDVLGQTLLIDMDICGVNIERRQPKPNEAALATGLLWYSMKLSDNYIDDNNLNGSHLEDFLSIAKESFRKERRVTLTNKDEERLINCVHDLINSGYIGKPAGYITRIEDLCNAELSYLSSHGKEKVEAAKVVGKISAELTLELAKQYVPEYPNGCENFLIEQGITAKLFDDFKDIKIDREYGRGYDLNEIPNLKIEGIIHFYRHFKELPKFKSKWKNLNFIALASLFHLKELLGKKEKS